MTYDTVDDFVKEYGEERRYLIEDSLAFLDAHEPGWNLDEPINRVDYIANIMQRSIPKEKSTMTEMGYSRIGLNNV